MYKTKSENKWNPKSGIWLPFSAVNEIMTKVYSAYETGIKLDWDKKPSNSNCKNDGIFFEGSDLWP